MSPQLSFDIQVEIIKRLPVKSLIQFRSVCKAWKSLIDSSQFIAGYNFCHDQSEHLLVSYEIGDEREVKYVSFVDDDTFPQQKFDLTIPPLVQATIVMGSSHGLLCLIGYLREPDGSCPTSETDIVVLWNPAIKKSISVVDPNVVQPPFDYVIGFGVCPDTKDPKLVKITYIDDQRELESISCIPCQVMVFTLSSGEWKTSCSNVPRKSIGFTWSSAVIGQFIYWRAYNWSDVDGERRNLIMSFDLSLEEFREIDLPDSLCGSGLSISRLRESLVLFEYNINATMKQVCNVWRMDHGDRKAFTKQFTIKAPDASVSLTVGFRKSGEPIIEMSYDDDDDEDEDEYEQCALVVYEPCLEQIKDLGICGNKYSFFGSSYTESLLLLDHEELRMASLLSVEL